ncbi:ATP-grasp domain-containing protein [Kribbella catacumbae]|uniref:ATP-grasp domain-containing protein n=1 Tax=Kribbella catacumbae TaxID=460086 RepID=UPI00036DC67D|nr:hypothetical protein [Kribbella catacumbae]
MTGTWILTDSRYLRQRMPTALVGALDRAGVEATVVCADRLLSEVGRDDVFAPAPGDLVVPRTRNPMALSMLCRAELAGARSCNSCDAVTSVRDKPRAALALARRGVPTPRTFLADHPAALRDLPGGAWPLLLKPSLGNNGEGIVLVDSPAALDRLAWPDDIVLAQQYVEVAGVDLKLYGCGDALWAVRRRSPLGRPDGPDIPVPAPVTDLLRDLAYACRDTFGLELYGIDVLPSQRGPLVVDVNDFPNYTGIGEAPDALADLVRARLTETVGA